MPTETPQRAIIGTPVRPYRRGVENAVLGGVCGGLAIRLGVKERMVRIVFSLLALVSGIGLLLYMVLWLAIPRVGESEPIAQRLIGRHRKLNSVVIGIVAIVAMFFFLDSLGLPALGVYSWPIFLTCWAPSASGAGRRPKSWSISMTWPSRRPSSASRPPRSGGASGFRLALGVIFIFFGLRILDHLGGAWGLATPRLRWHAGAHRRGNDPARAVVARDAERPLGRAAGPRTREERANVATHLHDSVLQTLTLIERAAGDEAAVVRLARTQERELRQWLFSPEG